MFVLLGGGTSQTNQRPQTGVPTDQSELVEAMREEIGHLRRESERKDTIIMSLSQANAEQARAIRELEPAPEHSDPPEARESDVSPGPSATPTDTGEGRETGTRRPWWRRVLGG